ncbi:MAG TPA: hypothetical protein VKR43_18880 [Bryobacteraceae bacterium]|nr:hypothetical protein [Bryobacteraceae bacterium]
MKIVAVIAAAYAVLVGTLAIAMRQPPDSFGAFMAKLPPVAFMVLPFQPLWMGARAGKLHVGQEAPVFVLKTADGGSEVRLDSFRGKRPVVLIFGSYT